MLYGLGGRFPMVNNFRKAYRRVFGFHDNYWRKRLGVGESRQSWPEPKIVPEAEIQSTDQELNQNYYETYSNNWAQSKK